MNAAQNNSLDEEEEDLNDLTTSMVNHSIAIYFLLLDMMIFFSLEICY